MNDQYYHDYDASAFEVGDYNNLVLLGSASACLGCHLIVLLWIVLTFSFQTKGQIYKEVTQCNTATNIAALCCFKGRQQNRAICTKI